MKKTRLLFLVSIVSIMSVLISVETQAIIVSDATELSYAIVQANSGGDKTIELQDGTYPLDDMLWVEADGVTVCSISGNRDAVIIEGRGMGEHVTHIFNIAGSSFTVRDVTLQRVGNHAIQLQPGVDSIVIQNIHILDTGEQMVKVSHDPNNPDLSSDNGIMERCLLEYSAGIGPQYYIGGIDAHNAKNWAVRDNTFIGIRSPSQDVAEHAIHFWSNSENTLVERNLIINCDRGIGFGLGDRGHSGGIIRNNMIYHDSSEGFADVGIALESAPHAQVYNNTIYQGHTYPNAIEYRFSSTTGVLIANNLTNKEIALRDGASGSVSHNVSNAEASWFSNPSIGNLHLSSPIPEVVDQGLNIPGLTSDFDGESRPQGEGFDIGADEYGSGSSKSISISSENENGSSSCFIATAAYGSQVEPHVKILQQFRDTYLLPSTLGCALVTGYYQYSPPVANFIARHENVRAIVRVGLLPFVYVSYITLYWKISTTTATIVIAFMTIISLIVVCFRRGRVIK